MFFHIHHEKNTPAAKMKGQVNDQIKHERANRLLQLSKELNHEFCFKTDRKNF